MGRHMKIDTIIAAVNHHKPVTLPETEISAAVLILVLIDEADSLSLLITKRPDIIQTYAGDYCFPGGMHEAEDKDLKATALREMYEETHISTADYQFIGPLDDFLVRFNQVVRPFVAIMTKNKFASQCQFTQSEIQDIYFLPLEDLAKLTTNKELELLTGRHLSYCYRHGDVFIWGLTASMLVHFNNVISGANLPLAKHRQ
jgi:8-oxo-dGTP pyrophosphatase MutT (NUDIX family)